MNSFYCIKNHTDDCIKTLTGQSACSICEHNKCRNCGRLNTKACLSCEKSVLTDAMKESLKKSFMGRVRG